MATAVADVRYAADLCGLGREAGLDAVGVAPADPFDGTRAILEQRRAQGLHGSMAFTYRNPRRSTTPAVTLPGAQALVVGALGYAGGVTAELGPARGRVARYATTDFYARLRLALSIVADRLKGDGWRAVVVADDNALVDREAAVRAGLGWYGKSSNVLLPGRGSWFVLGSVITDAPLPAADGPVDDGCGSCRRCLDGCPTGAIVAPGVVDARRCLAWLLQAEGDFAVEFRSALGDRMYGCDDCQEVCPPNRRGQRAPDEGGGVDVLGLLDSADDELLDRFGRWYIPRRDPRYLRRNALVVLGNTADPSDGRVVEVLARYLAHPDELLRSHAEWAAARLGRTDLLARPARP